MNLVLSLIPQRVRSVIGGLIMAVGGLLLLLGLAIVVVISEDAAFFLGACVGIVGFFISGMVGGYAVLGPMNRSASRLLMQ